MRRRMYYLLPNLASSRKAMDDLLLARVEECHIHFVAKEDTPMDGLHEASVLQKSDMVHGAQIGLVLGALFGTWVASMVGAAVPSSRLRKFESRIEKGMLLLMIDVPEHSVEEVKTLFGKTHPEAIDYGLERHIPVFP